MNGREPYLSAAATLLRESGCTVRRWRKSNTGIAATNDPDWAIECPEPRGPISFGILAHEVAHQLRHRERQAMRWRVELEAELWALDQFDRFGLPGVDAYRARAALHLRWSVEKLVRVNPSPATARAVLQSMPPWVWIHQDPRDAVVYTARERLQELGPQLPT